MALQIGKAVDDFEFRDAGEATVRLSDLPGRAAVLIFLRHLA